MTAVSTDDDPARNDEIEALKRRVAELLVECKANPYVGELMGRGLHPELADCRRVRFDTPTHKGRPRFRLISETAIRAASLLKTRLAPSAEAMWLGTALVE